MRAPYISFPRGWGKRGLLGCVGVYGKGYCTVDRNNLGACPCSSLVGWARVWWSFLWLVGYQLSTGFYCWRWRRCWSLIVISCWIWGVTAGSKQAWIILVQQGYRPGVPGVQKRIEEEKFPSVRQQWDVSRNFCGLNEAASKYCNLHIVLFLSFTIDVLKNCAQSSATSCFKWWSRKSRNPQHSRQTKA